MLLATTVRNPDRISTAAVILTLPLAALGGCWWPLEVVPGWMRNVGHVSPAAWALDGFHSLISYGAGWEAILVPCLVLLGYALVFTLIGARFLRVSE